VTRALEAGWPVVPTYGLTEAASGVTALATADARAFPGSAGRALPGVRIRIERPGVDGVGEILVSTPARFEGYLGDSAATEAAVAADGSIRTGDLGWLDADGRLFLADRRSDLIVRGGENVPPAEVEAVLVDHPAVAEAGVVGRGDPEWGQVAVAAIVLRPGVADPGDEALLLHCRERLAPYKVPTAFVRQQALPRTANGKLRRAELRVAHARNRDRDRSRYDRRVHRRTLRQPEGARLVYRTLGEGTPVLLLHATLSNAAQLGSLAGALAGSGRLRTIAVDRRGSGESRLAVPRPLEMSVHVADLTAILDAEGQAAAVLVGHSFGAVVALEFAARRPDRTIAIVAYEPPYAPVADDGTRQELAVVAAATERAYCLDGAASAAETFVRGVAGDAAWDELSERRRGVLEGVGDGAVADVSLRGLDLDGLGRIVAPVALLTGDASQPFYAGIADALAARIPGASRVALPGLRHPAPITDPAPVAAAVLAALVAAGILPPPKAEAGAPSPPG
jgi:pimeloyl-ACP methyl ester carboxylesterase